MNPINIEKHTAELVEGIRNITMKASGLKMGERNAILNKLDKLNVKARKANAQLRKANAQLQRGHYRTAAYDARTQEDMAAQARAKKAVFQAMMEGRRVDLTMADRFKVSQMHTAISQIRKDITRKNLPVILCDEWVRPSDGNRPYKQYWFIQKEQDGIC